MTYAEQLYAYMIMVTDAGYHLPIQNKDGDICIFSPMKDEDGNNRRSGWISSLEEAKKYLGCYVGCGKEQFIGEATKNNWKPLDPFMLETKPLPVGTEVKWKDEPRRRGKLFVGSFDYLVNTYNIVENLDDKFAFGARPDQIIPIFSPNDTYPISTYPMSEDEMIEALKKIWQTKARNDYCEQPDEKDDESKNASQIFTAFELKKNNWTIHNSPSPLTEITAKDALANIGKIFKEWSDGFEEMTEILKKRNN